MENIRISWKRGIILWALDMLGFISGIWNITLENYKSSVFSDQDLYQANEFAVVRYRQYLTFTILHPL